MGLNFFMRSCICFQIFALFAVVSLAPRNSFAQSTNDLRIYYPPQNTMSPNGVNIQTGRFIYSHTDLVIGTLKLVRSWGNESDFHLSPRVMGTRFQNNRLSSGWSHNFGQALSRTTESNAPYLIVKVDGARYKMSVSYNGVVYPWDKASVGTSFQGNVFTDKSGNRYTFGGYVGSPSGSVPLSHVDYADGSSLDYTYNASKQPRSIISNRGYAIVMDYDQNSNISSVCGYNTTQTFVGSNPSCAASTLKVSYGYDPTGQFLTSVTGTTGELVTISGTTIHGGNQVIGPTCISYPGSANCEVSNTYCGQSGGLSGVPCQKPYQVKDQTSVDGGQWLYEYSPIENPVDIPLIPGRPFYTEGNYSDPIGGGASARFNKGLLVDLNGPGGSYNYKYIQRVESTNEGIIATFELQNTSPTLVTFPDGHREYFFHSLRGNIPVRYIWPTGAPAPVDEAGAPLISTDPDLEACCIPTNAPLPGNAIVIGRTFLADYPSGTVFPTGCGSGPADAKLCDKVMAAFDGNGRRTDFTYAPAHGGVLTETGPADSRGIRPQTRYAYALRYAWVRNSAGTGYVQAPTPIWVLAQKSLCRTGPPAASGTGCANASDEVVTTYDYGPDSGPNNLLLRGVVEDATGIALRTCYQYDWRGNRISETKPRAGLGSCP